MTENLFYRKYGSGAKKLILFHGFGQDHQMFDGITDQLETTWTCYAFDLYYHGESLRADLPLTPDEWRQNFNRFLQKENIHSFSILSFSLGGRFALATAIAFPEQVGKLVLIAPDGIYTNFWYLFATSRIGNPLFRFLMHHPERFDRLIHLFEKGKLIAPSMIRFARKELSDPDNCLRAYRSWTWFRPLQLSPETITSVINAHKITVHLVLGEKDFIIPIAKTLPKVSPINLLQTHILPLKHHHLTEGVKDRLASWLNEENL